VIEIADRSLAHWHEHGFGWRPLLDKASGAKFGILMVNVMGDDAAAGVPGDAHEIGWWVHPDWWGAGYAREAAKAAAEYHFRELGFPELTARIQPPNTASIRVALSLGMTHRFDTTGRFGEPCAIYQVERPDAA
jgi:RimJ/RimL family protein N-acetyltransferase